MAFSTRIPVTLMQIWLYHMVVEMCALKRICVVRLLRYILKCSEFLLSDRIKCERASVARLKFSEARYKFPTIGCAGENQIKKHRTITNNVSGNFFCAIPRTNKAAKGEMKSIGLTGSWQGWFSLCARMLGRKTCRDTEAEFSRIRV